MRILSLILLITLLTFTLRVFTKPSAHESAADSERISAVLEAEISPDASVHWSVYCKKCGHRYEYSTNEGVVGLTKDELLSRFPEWHVDTFTREYVSLSREHDGYCPEHYIVFLEGDKIVVYSITEPDLEMEKLLDFDTEPYEISPAVKLILKNGLALPSLIELDKYTDGFKKPSE